jgi:hypothetical protein
MPKPVLTQASWISGTSVIATRSQLKQTDTRLRSSYLGSCEQLTPAPTHAVRHALRSPEGNRQVRWTGDVFGVYPLYDVYDNPRGTFVLRRKLELFLAHGRFGSPSHLLVKAEEMVELDGIEPTT